MGLIKNIILEQLIIENRKDDVFQKYIKKLNEPPFTNNDVQSMFRVFLSTLIIPKVGDGSERSTYLNFLIEKFTQTLTEQKYLDWAVGEFLRLKIQQIGGMPGITNLRHWIDKISKIINEFDDNLHKFNDKLLDELKMIHSVPVSVLYDEPKINKASKDIYSYSTIGSLDFVTNLAKTLLSKKDIKKIESDKIYEDDDVLIVSPKTHRASCYYGANTKWCTSSRDIGQYKHYANAGILFYLINKKNNEKLALYIPFIFTSFNAPGISLNKNTVINRSIESLEVFNELDVDITEAWWDHIYEYYKLEGMWAHIESYFEKMYKEKYVN